jgi:hypothetical protein
MRLWFRRFGISAAGGGHPVNLPRFIFLGLALLLASPTVRSQENGITVGQPKVYDNQALTIMLDQLNARLQQLQVVDQQSLLKALGLFQGSQQQDISRSFDISLSLTPKGTGGATESSAAPNTGSNSSSGNSGSPSATTSGSKSSSTSAANTASTSALPDLLPAPNFNPQYGSAAGDLLSDQVDLSYQIFNLRMILERALTDRLKDGQPRRQAVVSFNVTLDPPKDAQDAAAYVEITLNSQKGPLSLVASMPQEKTYNATALSSSSKAFGGSAVAKILTIGYNQRKRSQTFFLYRDCDTLAIERPAAGNGVTFGWVFRPVLGRRSVSPGMRQLFAVIALPDTDKQTDTVAVTLTASAKTFWLHYDHDSATTVTRPGFWDWSSKHLPPAATLTLANIEVQPTAPVEAALGPVVQNANWLPTTSGNSVIQVSGQNFFTGTTVTLGDKTLATPQDGLYIKSPESLLITASSDVLSRAETAVVNGRYGQSVPLFPLSNTGIVIVGTTLKPKGAQFTQLSLKIARQGSAAPLQVADITNVPAPVFSLNGTPITLRFALQNVPASANGCLQPCIGASAVLSNSMLQARDNRVGVAFPLLGEEWAVDAVIYDDSELQMSRMETGPSTMLLISRPGLQFDGAWTLILDRTYPLTDPSAAPESEDKGKKKKQPTTVIQEFSKLFPCQASPSATQPGCFMVKIVANTKLLSNYKEFVIVDSNGLAQAIAIPTETAVAKPGSTPPKIASVSPQSVGLDEVITATIKGSGLQNVKKVSFQGKDLTSWATAKGDQLDVLLTRDVTAKEGHQELLLQIDSKTFLTASIVVSAAGKVPPTQPSTERK